MMDMVIGEKCLAKSICVSDWYSESTKHLDKTSIYNENSCNDGLESNRWQHNKLWVLLLIRTYWKVNWIILNTENIKTSRLIPDVYLNHCRLLSLLTILTHIHNTHLKLNYNFFGKLEYAYAERFLVEKRVDCVPWW